MSHVGKVLSTLLGLLFAAVMITIIVAIAIWPGEAKLTAPLLCPDDRTEAVVVRDESNPRPGETVINFTLYCVGERGEATDVGFIKPFGLLVLFHLLLLLPLVLVRSRGRSGRRDRQIASLRNRGLATETGADPASDDDPFIPSSTPGPFVN